MKLGNELRKDVDFYPDECKIKLGESKNMETSGRSS
jgi:hypothetical protein